MEVMFELILADVFVSTNNCLSKMNNEFVGW